MVQKPRKADLQQRRRELWQLKGIIELGPVARTGLGAFGIYVEVYVNPLGMLQLQRSEDVDEL